MSRYFLFVSIILIFALKGFCAGSPVPGYEDSTDEFGSPLWKPVRGLKMMKIFSLDGGPPSPGGVWSSRARQPYTTREEYAGAQEI